MVNVSQRAWKAEGSRMFIEPRSAVSVDELMRGMIVQSGNDASIALAELVGRERGGVRREDERRGRAARHGQHALHQRDRPVRRRSTIRPPPIWRRLAAALIRDYPEYYPLYALKEFRYNNITQPNRNRLLWIDPYVDGMKTGHTDAAGWCLIASAHARRPPPAGRGAGCRSDAARAAEAQKLLNWGFQAFDTVAALPIGQAGRRRCECGRARLPKCRPDSSPTAT